MHVLPPLSLSKTCLTTKAVATGGISVYIPPPQKKNQSTLIFYVVFCLLDPGQIRVNIYTHPNQIPGYAPAYNTAYKLVRLV